MNIMPHILFDFYTLVTIYVISYPLITSVVWDSFSIYYKMHWEDHQQTKYAEYLPKVSIIVPAYNEGKGIEKGLRAILNIAYENFEVVVVNDGSQDNTIQACLPFLANPRLRIIDKKINQGKAMALNDALPCLNGDIIVTLDADAEPEPNLLHNLVWHFRFPGVGAVTGHPRVKNVVNLLARIQLVEFCSIIGLLRRSQRIWGRIVTISGIVSAFRKEALYDVKGFHPDMYTEDIDITWRLQRRHWDVHYEPRAVVWMDVPTTLHEFFKQRLRWARGLMQVLRRHFAVIRHWSLRKMWLIYVESCLSILWCIAYGIVFSIEMLRLIISYTLGLPIGTPLQWAMVLFTATLLQLSIGLILEYKYDPQAIKFAPYIIFYPLFYWLFMVAVTLVALPVLWRSWKGRVLWSSKR